MKKVIVNNDNVSKRLDVFLSKELNETRSLISKSIKEGKIKVNDNIIKCGYVLKENDLITIENLTIDTDIKGEVIDLDILYEDEYIIVVNKKSGMVVHPGNGNYEHTLVNALMAHTRSLSNVSGENRCGIVHRIDKDTSGILLIAKTNKVHSILGEEFKNHNIKRKYIALVHGIMDANNGKIIAPIGRSKTDRKKMCVTEDNSKKATTNFKVLERYKNATLVELILETGRTHQIRVHMEYINHPVINDPVYGKKKKINDYGQMLHAYYLGFNHPITKEFMEFEVAPEEEFNKIIELFKNS